MQKKLLFTDQLHVTALNYSAVFLQTSNSYDDMQLDKLINDNMENNDQHKCQPIKVYDIQQQISNEK